MLAFDLQLLVELDAPIGKNNGTIGGHVYATVGENRGVLVKASKIGAAKTFPAVAPSDGSSKTDVVNTVTLDRSNGNSIGIKVMKGSADGFGIAVKSVEPGGQAEATGKLQAGTVFSHVNGTDVTGMKLKDIGALIKQSDSVVFTIASMMQAQVAVEPPKPEQPQPNAVAAAKPTKKGSKTGSKKASKKAASATAFAVGAVVSVEGYACNGTVRFVGPHHEGKGERVRKLGS